MLFKRFDLLRFIGNSPCQPRNKPLPVRCKQRVHCLDNVVRNVHFTYSVFGFSIFKTLRLMRRFRFRLSSPVPWRPIRSFPFRKNSRPRQRFSAESSKTHSSTGSRGCASFHCFAQQSRQRPLPPPLQETLGRENIAPHSMQRFVLIVRNFPLLRCPCWCSTSHL